jgi:small subunit ribosomal protein S20
VPNIKSAKKRHRQSLERRARNRSAKSQLKTAIKKLREAVEAKKFDEDTIR